MNRDFFWLTKDQFARLKPLLLTDTRGKPRVDNRRVISGIVHVLKCGGRWIDAPDVYGPSETLYTRFVCWAAKGVWSGVERHLPCSGIGRWPTAGGSDRQFGVKAHCCASGGKRGAQSGHRPLARRAHHQDPRPDRQCVPPHCIHADR
jgi:transposase